MVWKEAPHNVQALPEFKCPHLITFSCSQLYDDLICLQNKQVCSSSGKRKSHLVMGIDFREIFFYIDNFHEHLLFVITDRVLSHQSMVYLLHIRKSLSVLYQKKVSFNFELLPLSRSIGLYSHFLQIKHQGKINYKWQW